MDGNALALDPNIYDVLDPTRQCMFTPANHFAPEWKTPANPDPKDLTSHLTWAVGTANSKLFAAINERSEHQNRVNASALNASHTKISKISLLEKQLVSVQQVQKELREQATRSLLPTNQPANTNPTHNSAHPFLPCKPPPSTTRKSPPTTTHPPATNLCRHRRQA